MRTSDRGIAALVAHEGIVPAPYKDSVGVETFGIGHTSAAGPPDPRAMPRGMPKDLDAALRIVFDLFREDLGAYEASVRNAVKVPMAQHEFDALVSFHFNTGAIHRAELVKALNRGDRKAAAAGFMGWKKPAAIIPRREAEQRLFRDGVYPATSATVWGATPDGRVVWSPVRRLTQEQILSYLRPGAQPKPAPEPSRPPVMPSPVPPKAAPPSALADWVIPALIAAAVAAFLVFGG